MGELSQPEPGMQCEVPRDTIVYMVEFDPAYASLWELCRVKHRTTVLVVGTAASIDLVMWSLCLVPVPTGGIIGWIYNRNLRVLQ